MENENTIEDTGKDISVKSQGLAKDLIGESKNQYLDKADDLVGKAQDFFGKISSHAGEWGTTLAEQMKAKPLFALAVAIAIGFGIQTLVRRRR